MSEIPLVQKASLQSSFGAPEEIFTAWRESISPYFDSQPLFEVGEAPPIALNASQYHLGCALFYDSVFSRQKFVRDTRWGVQHDDADHVLLQVWKNGHNTVKNGDAHYTEGAGNVYAVNLSHNVDATCSDAHTLSLALPRDWLNLHLPGLVDIRGKLFSEDWSMAARIFNDYMTSLSTNLPFMKVSELSMVQDNILAMLESLVAYGDIESEAVKSNSLAVICAYIDKRLRDPNLGVESICKQFRCSRATVYRLFKPHGGVRGFIQKRRLMASFKALTSPTQAHKQVFEIAREFGFSNPSHFSSLFRHHFDMTPKAAREAGFIRRHGVSGRFG